MLPDISEIRALRKRLGITQAELARMSGVSQSLIAKIEGSQTVPGYEKARKLFEALEKIGKKKEARAADIMSRKVKSIRPGESARTAVAIMEKNGFSQLPVIKQDKCIGIVTESGALSALRAKGSEFDLLTASAIMDEPLPIVSTQALFPVLAGILNHEHAVLVAEHGKIVGIITKSDLLKKALEKK
ncbi:MAG: CBS domain-containing protein [Candidatus Diapherotrites archaeon]